MRKKRVHDRTNCAVCNIELDELNRVVFDGRLKSMCRKCYNEKARGRYDSAVNRDRQLKKNFGLSLDDYSELFNKQMGVCAICLKPSDRTLHVDHNHLTGEVRALLCHKCNHAIGLVDENPDLIMRMYEYLLKNTWLPGLKLVEKKDVS